MRVHLLPYLFLDTEVVILHALLCQRLVNWN